MCEPPLESTHNINQSPAQMSKKTYNVRNCILYIKHNFVNSQSLQQKKKKKKRRSAFIYKASMQAMPSTVPANVLIQTVDGKQLKAQ